MSVDSNRIEQLFQESLKHAHHLERHRFLSKACGDDAGLWNAVWDRLRTHFSAGTGRLNAVSAARSDEEKPGDVLEGCHLLQIVGEGVSTVVWMAERAAQVAKCVAVKIVNTPANDFLLRYSALQPALFALEHPGIAKIHASGMTTNGKPFIISELASGLPITRFCDDQKLPLRARVRLFLQVCEAVHHAHQKGVAHGSLKPGNVLVHWNGEGQPVFKITDFGFAHAMGPILLGPEGTPRTPVAYLPPEQAGSGKINAKGDIHALGALLFELLTGRQPIILPRQPANLDDLRRLVREAIPAYASISLKSLSTAQVTGIALSRRMDPSKLMLLAEQYFDGVLLRAMHKQPHARQENVVMLADSLHRYMQAAEEEDSLMMPKAGTTVGNFVSRNRGLFATAAVLVLSLCGALMLTGWLLVREKLPEHTAKARQKSETQSLTAKFLEEMFASLTPESLKGRDTTLLKEMLDGASGKLDTLRYHPEAGARMQETLGLTYLAISEKASAQKQLHGALEKRQQVLGGDHPDTLRSMRQLAVVFKEQGRHAEAESLLRQTLEKQQRVLGPEHPDTFITITVLAAVCEAQDRPWDSEMMMMQLWKLQKRVLGPDHLETLATIGNIGALLSRQGRHAEAIEMRHEHLNAARRVHGARHPQTVVSMTITAEAHEAGGQPSEAEKLYVGAMEILRKTLGPEHPQTLAQMDKVAHMQRRLGRYDEALKLQHESLDTKRRVFGAQHPETLLTMRGLAETFEEDGQKAAAEAVQLEVLEILKNLHGPAHTDTLEQTETVAQSFEHHGKHAQAVELRQRVLEINARSLGRSHPQTLQAMRRLARSHDAAGQRAEAEALHIEAFEAMKIAYGAGDPDTLEQMRALALMQSSHDRHAEAEKLCREMLQIQQRTLGIDHPDTLRTLHTLAKTMQQQGRLPEAEALLQEILKRERTRSKVVPPSLADAADHLGQFWLGTGRPADAEPLLRECLALRLKHLPDDWRRFSAESLLGGALLAQRKPVEAGPLLRSGHDGLQKRLGTIPGEERHHMRDAIELMAQFVEATEGAAAAAAWKRKLVEFDQAGHLAGR
jgi:serine/threonine protein kinase/tetratricopeptide (TPR) repeat protein